jgi:phage terminase small subunit
MTDQPPKRRRRQKYSAAPLATVPDTADLGPAMLALTPKQRQFVMELRHGPAGYGSEVRAARAAGYGTPTSSDLSMRVQAHQVLHNIKIQNALREVGGKVIRAEAFQSIKNTVAIANDLAHRDCLKANLALLDRGGFATETIHHVVVEKTVKFDPKDLVEKLQKISLRFGLDARKVLARSPVIEGEYQEEIE